MWGRRLVSTPFILTFMDPLSGAVERIAHTIQSELETLATAMENLPELSPREHLQL